MLATKPRRETSEVRVDWPDTGGQTDQVRRFLRRQVPTRSNMPERIVHDADGCSVVVAATTTTAANTNQPTAVAAATATGATDV